MALPIIQNYKRKTSLNVATPSYTRTFNTHRTPTADWSLGSEPVPMTPIQMNTFIKSFYSETSSILSSWDWLIYNDDMSIFDKFSIISTVNSIKSNKLSSETYLFNLGTKMCGKIRPYCSQLIINISNINIHYNLINTILDKKLAILPLIHVCYNIYDLSKSKQEVLSLFKAIKKYINTLYNHKCVQYQIQFNDIVKQLFSFDYNICEILDGIDKSKTGKINEITNIINKNQEKHANYDMCDDIKNMIETNTEKLGTNFDKMMKDIDIHFYNTIDKIDIKKTETNVEKIQLCLNDILKYLQALLIRNILYLMVISLVNSFAARNIERKVMASTKAIINKFQFLIKPKKENKIFVSVFYASELSVKIKHYINILSKDIIFDDISEKYKNGFYLSANHWNLKYFICNNNHSGLLKYSEKKNNNSKIFIRKIGFGKYKLYFQRKLGCKYWCQKNGTKGKKMISSGTKDAHDLIIFKIFDKKHAYYVISHAKDPTSFAYYSTNFWEGTGMWFSENDPGNYGLWKILKPK